MSNQPIDPETLAALLDGTLPAAEREKVLSTLVRSDEPYYEFLEAQAILRQLDDDTGDGQSSAGSTAPPQPEPPPADTPPPAPAPRLVRAPEAAQQWRRRAVAAVVPLLAAGIAAVLLMRPPAGPEPARVLAVTRQLGERDLGDRTLAAQLGTAWDRPSWSAVRGSEDGLSTRARAFRMGVRLAQFELGAAVADTAAVALVALPLARLAASVPGGVPAAARVEQVARLGTPAPAVRDSLAAELRVSTEAPLWFDLGVWSETARLAARGGHASFFDSSSAGMQKLRDLLQAVDDLGREEQRAGAYVLRHLESLDQRPAASPIDLGATTALLDSAVAAGGGHMR